MTAWADDLDLCCVAGAVAWPHPCPWHDAWRTPLFQAPPDLPDHDDDTEETDQP